MHEQRSNSGVYSWNGMISALVAHRQQHGSCEMLENAQDVYVARWVNTLVSVNVIAWLLACTETELV